MSLIYSIPCLLLMLSATGYYSIAAAANITIGTTLTAGKSTSSWSSPSGDFTFGFYPVNTSVFVFAIWFNKTNPQAVVWRSNYTVPELQSGSTLQLTDDGQLSLKNHVGVEVWNPQIVKATALALLDSGNLVLVGNDGGILWQSFDFFTDTLLPGQVMKLGTFLRSRLNVSDYSEGRFQLTMQTDGNLVLNPVSVLGGTLYGAYWSSGTINSRAILVYNNSSSLYLNLPNNTQFNFFSSQTFSSNDFYQRATLDFDGVFRRYVYPKTKNSSIQQEWTIIDHVPDNICTAIVNDFGSGACGYNSYCALDELGMVQCKCPDGYSFFNQDAHYKGCKPDFVVEDCNENSSVVDQYEFKVMNGIDWPRSDYEHYTNVNEQQCSDNCLNDCFCAVVIIHEQECWKKKLPLSNGQTGADRRALIKVGKTNASLTPTEVGKRNASLTSTDNLFERERKINWVIPMISSGTLNVIVIIVIVVLLILYKKKKNKLKWNELKENDSDVSDLNLRSFAFKELESATNGFSEELGRGSFGTVYKGILQSNIEKKIAVKKLVGMLQDNEKEFLNEARAIGQTHHKNLVKLIGICNEGTHRLLVYEYMSNGSLNNFLFGPVRPKWNQRVQFALNIARGLLYLHEECSIPIIHCDIKPQNVLLDNNFVAKISDFGLAKLLKADQTRTFISIRGTRGYVAPEWFKGKIITKKVDVYSFGVMLLEIISCRKSIIQVTDEQEPIVLVDWTYDCYKEGVLEAVVDNEEDAIADFGRLERFVMVAIWCIQEDPTQRPSMHKVLQMLDGSAEVSPPPDPLSNI